MKPFENVMGYSSLKQELLEIIDIMQNPGIYKPLGANCPNGLLLYGPPGVGKTLIATSFIEASERSAVICRKNASQQSFIDSISASFAEALEKAPSIILLDDMDKFANDDDDHKDSEAYVTIQACIDNVKGADVFVLATANNIKKLPNSLIRTGRFDRRVEIDKPNDEDSIKIISHYLSGKHLSSGIDIKVLASLFKGVSCSTLETIINQAAVIAGYKRAPEIAMEDMVQSYLQIEHDVPREFLSTSNRTDLYTPNGDTDVIWHEAGHVAMAEILSPGSVSIAIASGVGEESKGFAVYDFMNSKMSSLSRTKINILVALASAATMDIMFGRIDPGASEDVRNTIDSLDGLSAQIGGFAGFSFAAHGYMTSEFLSARREISSYSLAELYYQEAKEILCRNRTFLEAIAKALAVKTVLTLQDIKSVRESMKIEAVKELATAG